MADGSTVAVPTAEATKLPRKKRDAWDPPVWVDPHWPAGRPVPCLATPGVSRIAASGRLLPGRLSGAGSMLATPGGPSVAGTADCGNRDPSRCPACCTDQALGR